MPPATVGLMKTLATKASAVVGTALVVGELLGEPKHEHPGSSGMAAAAATDGVRLVVDHMPEPWTGAVNLPPPSYEQAPPPDPYDPAWSAAFTNSDGSDSRPWP